MKGGKYFFSPAERRQILRSTVQVKHTRLIRKKPPSMKIKKLKKQSFWTGEWSYTCSTYFEDISVLHSGNNSRIAIEWKKNDYRGIALFSFFISEEAMPLLDWSTSFVRDNWKRKLKDGTKSDFLWFVVVCLLKLFVDLRQIYIFFWS